MPSRSLRTGKPTVYLDHSHLCEGFKDRFGLGAPGYSGLGAWIEHVAADANLVFSGFHVFELSRWGDDVGRVGMADWLESLDIVWARSKETVELREEEHWLKRVLGLDAAPVEFSAPSLLSSLDDVRPEDLPFALSRANIPTFVAEARRAGFAFDPNGPMPDSGESVPWKATLLDDLARLRTDRVNADVIGLDAPSRERMLAENRARDLKERGEEAHDRLRGDPEYAGLKVSRGDAALALVGLTERDPTALPLWRIVNGMVGEMLKVGIGRTAGSNKEAQLGSAPADAMHAAIGGAYCDVFTCDSAADAWIGDMRERIGFGRQLSVRGSGAAGFVTTLQEAFERAALFRDRNGAEGGLSAK